MRAFLFLSILLLLAFTARGQSLPAMDAAIDAYHHRDYTNAFKGFSDLAKAGDARAQTILALMYRFGEGIPVDLPEALHWYQQAAKAGYAPAQYHLANMLAAGMGTPVDEPAATRWLQLSAGAGFDRARERLAELTLLQDERLPDWSRTDAGPETRAEASTKNGARRGASAGIREIVEWNLRLPNQWRLNPANEQDDMQAINHLPRLERHDYRIQLGVFDSRPRAVAFWQRLVEEYPELFRHLQPFIESSAHSALLSQKAPFTTHRIQAGNFKGFAAATAMCDALLAARVESGCLPVAITATGNS